MIRIASERQLLESFRPIDRDEVELPKDLAYPFLITQYFAWTEPSGYRSFIVFEDENDRRHPRGIVFRRDQSAGGANARMCEWCHSIRSGDEIGVLTATASSRRRVGLSLCRDLSCKEKAENQVGDLFTTSHERARRVLERVSLFARQSLF